MNLLNFAKMLLIFLFFTLFISCDRDDLNLDNTDFPDPTDNPETTDIIDTEAPIITNFSIISGNLTVESVLFINITSSDNIGVTAWMIDESPVQPDANDPDWQTSEPSTYSLSSGYGPFTLYAWVKDAANNISSQTINSSYSGQYKQGIIIPQTGQVNCYDTGGTNIPCSATGQDGEFMYGKVWGSPRFIDNADGTIYDNLTGLLWITDGNLMITRDPGFDAEGTVNDGKVNAQSALNYVNLLNGSSYSGYNTWRLPNILELMSLINFGETSTITWMQSFGFNNIGADYYWSSTTYINNTTFSWAYSFATSTKEIRSKTAFYYVIAVTGTSQQVPVTGQVDCFDNAGTAIPCAGTGQDGELQSGFTWPVPRFIDNADGTITDELTGLMWLNNGNIMISQHPAYDTEDTVNDGKVTWQTALNYVNQLNIENHSGYNDWRLPNFNELFSIYNHGVVNWTWLSSFGFSGVNTQNHWSSTTSENSPASIHRLNIMYGAATLDVKTDFRYVFPVRGGY